MPAIGTNLYGGVEPVGKTQIKTMFFMIGYLPLSALDSYYYIMGSERPADNQPLFGIRDQFLAVRLERPYPKSVKFGYLRSWFAALSGMVSLVLLAQIFGNPFVEGLAFTLLMAGVWISSIIVWIWAISTGNKVENNQDRLIRTIADKILGIALDPKYIEMTAKTSIKDHLKEKMKAENREDLDATQLNANHPRTLAFHLLLARCLQQPQSRDTGEILRLIEVLKPHYPIN